MRVTKKEEKEMDLRDTPDFSLLGESWVIAMVEICESLGVVEVGEVMVEGKDAKAWQVAL